MSIDYEVRVRYTAEDGASGPINRVAGAGNHASVALGAMSSAAGALGGMLDNVASRAISVAGALAGIAAAGALAAIKDGVAGVNAELESSSLAIASSLNILGGADGFNDGLTKAQELVAGIKKDSASLPGEFQDFVGIAQTLTPALTNAGQGIGAIRQLTKDTAVAAASVGVGFDQAGREMAQLLAGNAGAHNVLGMRLGITKDTKITDDTGTHAFKDASTISRLEFMEKTLAKAKDSLPAFSNSFGGLASTLKDTVRSLFGEGTAGIFERVKDVMKDLIAELDSPKAHAFAHEVGEKLVEAFDWLVEKTKWLGDHWEQIRDTAVSFAEQVRSAFEKAWPFIEKIGSFLGDKLKDPMGSLKELAGVRLGLGAVEHAPSIINGISSLAGGGEGLAAAAGPAAIALIALAGAVDVVTQKEGAVGSQMNGIIAAGKSMWGDIKDHFGGTLKDLGAGLSDLLNALRPIIDILGVGLLAALDVMSTEMEIVAGAFKALAGVLNDFMVFLGLAKGPTLTPEQAALLGKAPNGSTIIDTNPTDALGNKQADYETQARMKELIAAGAMASKRDELHQAYFDQYGTEMDDSAEKKASAAAPTISAIIKAQEEANRLAGKGGTTVTVHAPLTVLSDADPDRLAAKVAHHISGELRNLKRPIGIPSYMPG